MANDLEPARFERKKERAFAPKLPWKIIVPVGLVLVGMIGFYQWRERSKAHQLRQEIGASYQAHVVPVRERIESFRGVLEGWVMEAAANEEGPESWADPRLNLAGLHRAQGIYLRIHADQATDPESIAEAARIMGPDAIARCLGLSPTSLRGFYDRLQFLDPAWLESKNCAGELHLFLRNARHATELYAKAKFPGSQQRISIYLWGCPSYLIL